VLSNSLVYLPLVAVVVVERRPLASCSRLSERWPSTEAEVEEVVEEQVAPVAAAAGRPSTRRQQLQEWRREWERGSSIQPASCDVLESGTD